MAGVENTSGCIIEAILFTMGESVELGKIASGDRTGRADDRERSLQDHDGALRVGEQGESGSLNWTESLPDVYERRKTYDYLIRDGKAAQTVCTLTEVLLETLSIVAYKQPDHQARG